jgi:hypothetical protein
MAAILDGGRGHRLQVVCMIIIIIKFPCEIIILQIYDRNKYYIIEVPDIKGTQ